MARYSGGRRPAPAEQTNATHGVTSMSWCIQEKKERSRRWQQADWVFKNPPEWCLPKQGVLDYGKKHKRVFDAAFCFGKSAALRVPAGDSPACLLSKNFSYLGSELSEARYVPHRLRNSLIPKLEEGESCSQWADSCCLASCPLFWVVSSRCSLWRLGSSWLFWKSPGHMVGDIARSVWPIAQTKLRKSILLAGRTFNKEIRVGLSSILYLCLHASRSDHAFNFVWWVVFFLFHWIVTCMPMSTTCKASVKPLVTTTPHGWGAFSTAAFHFADGFGPFEFCHFCFRWFLWQIWLCAGLEPAPPFPRFWGLPF